MARVVAVLSSACLLTVLSLNLFFNATTRAALVQSQQDLVTACKVLKAATESSNRVTEKENIVLYRNVYRALRAKVQDGSQLQSEDAYFNQLSQMNAGSNDVPVLISFNSAPRRPKGGWTHKDVESLFALTDQGFKFEDFRAVIQLKDALDKLTPREVPKTGIRP